MQTATFVKTVKWLYALEIDDALEFFRSGFQEYLKAGRAGLTVRIDDTYARGIQLNNRVRQIEEHAEATALLDAFGLSSLYDAEWWQSLVAAFLRVLATTDEATPQADTVRELLGSVESLTGRMEILINCVGPLQQLVVPTSVLRLSDYDDVLTLEVHSSSDSDALAIGRVEAVLSSTDELYRTMCRIYGNEEPEPLRVLHMSSETGFRFDLSGDPGIIVDLKKLLVDVWMRIRNQDSPYMKDLNRAIGSQLAPYQRIEARLEAKELTQETASQLRHQLASLAIRMFDHGVQIREIPDTDTIDNRRLMEQIRQRRLPAPVKIAEGTSPAAAAEPTPSARETKPTAEVKTRRTRSAKKPAKTGTKTTKRRTSKRAG